MQVWRICKERYKDVALNGEGARLYAGRWNPVGVRMVYTSASLALAAVELFVHLDPYDAPEDLISVSATWSRELVSMEKLGIDSLPADWRAAEHHGLRERGAAWIASARSAALMVPSLAVEGEWNLLLNPAHRDFANVNILPPQPFHFDQRMFKSVPGREE